MSLRATGSNPPPLRIGSRGLILPIPQLFEDTVQGLQGPIPQHELAAPRAGVIDPNKRAEAFAQNAFQACEIGIRPRFSTGLLRCSTKDQSLQLPYT